MVKNVKIILATIGGALLFILGILAGRKRPGSADGIVNDIDGLVDRQSEVIDELERGEAGIDRVEEHIQRGENIVNHSEQGIKRAKDILAELDKRAKEKTILDGSD